MQLRVIFVMVETFWERMSVLLFPHCVIKSFFRVEFIVKDKLFANSCPLLFAMPEYPNASAALASN